MFGKMIKFIALSLISISMIVLLSCEDRGTNVPAVSSLDGGGPWPTADHIFSPELRWLLSNNIEQLPTWIYIPRVAGPPPSGISRPVPLLILLAPQGANKFYFAQHGLQELLKEMIADGTIQPMVVACPSNDPTFGGFMYAGGYNFSHPVKVIDSITPPTGNNDAIFSKQLVNWINSLGFTLQGQQKTGIGGFGMGAYGAFRAALLSDAVYGSISVTDGPLDFDGDPGLGFGNGLIDLFDDALIEQGLLNGNLQDFDSSTALPISNLFIGAAYAFSPDDTVLFEHNSSFLPPPVWKMDSTYGFVDSLSPTLITGFNAPSGFRFDYLLPFDASGAVYSPVWDNYWLTENLKSLIDSSTNKLSYVNLWFATTTESKINYYQQTQSWINTLKNPPYVYSVTEKKYLGVPGSPASGDQYVYDLLREMLIFHSNSFGN